MGSCLRSLRHALVSGSSALAVATLAMPALAQDATASSPAPAAAPAPNPPAPGGREIIVTANKRAQNINDVGLSITALSGNQLTQKGITNSQDLSKVVPAFTVASAADGTPVYTLRGVGFNSANIAAQPTVSAYNDQVKAPRVEGRKRADNNLPRRTGLI